MAKLLNGKINENGVIVAFNSIMERVYNGADDSLLYRKYKSGNVEATIDLAEFDDGQAASSSDVFAGYTGYGSGVHIRDKTDRDAAIKKEKDRIIDFLKEVISANRSEKPKSTDINCKKVLEQIYYDNPVYRPSSSAHREEESRQLELGF